MFIENVLKIGYAVVKYIMQENSVTVRCDSKDYF